MSSSAGTVGRRAGGTAASTGLVNGEGKVVPPDRFLDLLPDDGGDISDCPNAAFFASLRNNGYGSILQREPVCMLLQRIIDQRV